MWDEQSIKSILNEVNEKVRNLRKSEELRSKESAPRFNSLSLYKISEMDLSKIFKSLLNPKGIHGQDSLFLDGFLNYFQLNNFCDFVKIATEEPTLKNRRIDIYIEFDNGCIGIENKPDAGDSTSQLYDYYIDLKSRKKNYKLLYFSQTEPDLHSLTKRRGSDEEDGYPGVLSKDDYEHITYSDLAKWLDSSLASIKPLKIKFFIEDLIAYLLKKFEGVDNMLETKIVADLIYNEDKKIESAFLVQQSIPALKIKLINELQNNISTVDFIRDENIVGKSCLTKKISDNFRKNECLLFSLNNQNDDFQICFEFTKKGLRNLQFGIRRKDNLVVEKKGGFKWQKIQEKMIGIYGSNDNFQSEWWPWISTDFSKIFGDGSFRNWDHSKDPWIAIKNASMEEYIRLFIKKIYSDFGDDISLLK